MKHVVGLGKDARDLECGDLSPLFVRGGLFEANEKR